MYNLDLTLKFPLTLEAGCVQLLQIIWDAGNLQKQLVAQWPCEAVLAYTAIEN